MSQVQAKLQEVQNLVTTQVNGLVELAKSNVEPVTKLGTSALNVVTDAANKGLEVAQGEGDVKAKLNAEKAVALGVVTGLQAVAAEAVVLAKAAAAEAKAKAAAADLKSKIAA